MCTYYVCRCFPSIGLPIFDLFTISPQKGFKQRSFDFFSSLNLVYSFTADFPFSLSWKSGNSPVYKIVYIESQRIRLIIITELYSIIAY